MDFIKKYLKTPISAANEKGEVASLKFGILSLVIFFAYTFLCKIVSAWKLANAVSSYFSKKISFGDKVENYIDYLFKNEGILSILKSSLITVILFAVFVLLLFAVLKIFKKENADYLKISTKLLLTNLYVIPINLVLGLLGLIKVKFFIYLTLFLSIVYVIAFIVLNIFAIHKIVDEEDHDKSFRMIMIAIVAFILLIALVSFLFGDNSSSSLSILNSLSGSGISSLLN